MADESLLDLETAETERPFLTIDAKKYDVNTTDDLGITALAKISAIGKRIAKIMGKGDLTEADASEAQKNMTLVVNLIVVDLPADIEAKLKDGQKMAIINAFTKTAGVKPETAPSKETPETVTA